MSQSEKPAEGAEKEKKEEEKEEEEDELSKLTVKQITSRLTALGYTHVKGKKADLLEKLRAGKPKPGEEAIAPSKSGGSGKKRGRKNEEEGGADKEKEEGEKAEKSAKTDSPAKAPPAPEERVAALDNAEGAKHHEPAAGEAAAAPKGE